MKKLLIIIGAILPMTLMAEDFLSIKNRMPATPTAEQIVSEKANTQLAEEYKKIEKACEEEQTRTRTLAQKTAEETAQRAQAAPKMTKEQQQASQALAGDMISMMQQAGLSMDQLENMSDEEIMAAIAPMMAHKMGLSPEEFARMQGMSDAEAEAYVKQGNRSQRVQNSEFGQYGKVMQGIESNAISLNAQEDAAVNRMNELFMESMEYTPYIQTNMSASWQRTLNTKVVDFTPYEERIVAILNELFDRYDKEEVSGKGGVATTPAYAKAYYERINAIVDEYNLAAAKAWRAQLMPIITEHEKGLQISLNRYKECCDLYASLKSDDAKYIAGGYFPIDTYAYMTMYIDMLNELLAYPKVEHYEMPEMMSNRPQ